MCDKLNVGLCECPGPEWVCRLFDTYPQLLAFVLYICITCRGGMSDMRKRQEVFLEAQHGGIEGAAAKYKYTATLRATQDGGGATWRR